MTAGSGGARAVLGFSDPRDYVIRVTHQPAVPAKQRES